MSFDSHHALQLLRLGCGQPAAGFREGQEEAIGHVVEGRGRLLVVSAFPSREEAARVLAALEAAPEGLSVPQLPWEVP